MERIFGFEILPAPFVVAHLQMGLLLQHLKAPLLQENSERAQIYLTNSLTGWASTKEAKQQLLFPELEQERAAADGIKRDKPILVILGNPPYNAFAGVSSAEENNVVDLYKEGLNQPVSEGGYAIKKFNLDDLYVRFLRIAERRIVESKLDEGVICFITNFSFLRRDSYVVMRQRFFNEFDSIWFDCLNGDSRETGKLTPDGLPDPSVFSTEYHPVGIRLGTVISIFVRRPQRNQSKKVLYKDFWGVNKRIDLLNSLGFKEFDDQYIQIKPSKKNRYLFKPTVEGGKYETWPRLVDLCKVPPINGLMEKRGGSLIDIDHLKLEEKMKTYFDPNVDWETLKILGIGLTKDAAGFNAKEAHQKILASEQFQSDRVVSYALRPFDNRWCYYSGTNPLWNRSRPTLWTQYTKHNYFLMSRPAGVASPEGIPFFFTCRLGDNDFLRGHAYYFPLKHYVEKNNDTKLFPEKSSADWEPNLSPEAQTYLEGLGITDSYPANFADYIWLHALAIGISPRYLIDNADGLRRDWPRIPLPDSKELLLASVKLGKNLADLLDSESVEGVTSGKIRKELSSIGSVAKADGTAINLEKGDLDLTAEWGYIGKDGAIMPGGGRVALRDYSPEELAHLSQGAPSLGLSVDEILELLGSKVTDVYLNGNVFWRGIPENVWNTTVGGYQVIKKWLSYRNKKVLGRGLNVDEVYEVTNIARRIAAIILMYPSLDENYELAKGNIGYTSAGE